MEKVWLQSMNSEEISCNSDQSSLQLAGKWKTTFQGLQNPKLQEKSAEITTSLQALGIEQCHSQESQYSGHAV